MLVEFSVHDTELRTNIIDFVNVWRETIRSVKKLESDPPDSVFDPMIKSVAKIVDFFYIKTGVPKRFLVQIIQSAMAETFASNEDVKKATPPDEDPTDEQIIEICARVASHATAVGERIFAKHQQVSIYQIKSGKREVN